MARFDLNDLGLALNAGASAIEKYGKQATLSELGQQMQSGDYKNAARTALSAGDLASGLKLIELGKQTEANAAAAADFGKLGGLGALGGGAQPQQAASPAPTGPAQLTGGNVAEEFRKLGYGPTQIAGILGNFKAESNFNTGAIGDGGTSGGLGQWHNDRLANLKNFAAQNGADWRDPKIQVAFTDHELRTSESPVMQKLQAARTPEEAALAFAGFERPQGWTPNNPAGAMHMDRRIAAANQFGGGQPVQVADASGAIPQSAGGGAGGGDQRASLLAQRVELRKILARNPNMSDAYRNVIKSQDEVLDLQMKELDRESWKDVAPPAGFQGVAQRDAKSGKLSLQRFGPDTQVNIAGEKAYEQTVGKGYGETMLELQKFGRSAPGAISSLKLLEKATDTPGFYSGSAEGIVNAARKAAVSLGVADAGSAAPGEIFAKVSNKLVLDLAGGSLGTGFSNADRDYLSSTVPNLANTPEGNKQIIGIMKAVEQRKVDIAQLARDYAKANNGRIDQGFDDKLAQWTDANPLFKDAAPAAPATKAPQGQLKQAPADILNQARSALSARPDKRDAILNRLRENGVDPSGL